MHAIGLRLRMAREVNLSVLADDLTAAIDRHERLHPIEQHTLDREAAIDQVGVVEFDVEPLPGHQRRAIRLVDIEAGNMGAAHHGQ